MASFFKDTSTFDFGIIDDSGNFSALDSGSTGWRNEHGDVCIRLKLKARGYGWDDLFAYDEYSPALLFVHLQYHDGACLLYTSPSPRDRG